MRRNYLHAGHNQDAVRRGQNQSCSALWPLGFGEATRAVSDDEERKRCTRRRVAPVRAAIKSLRRRNRASGLSPEHKRRARPDRRGKSVFKIDDGFAKRRRALATHLRCRRRTRLRQRSTVPDAHVSSLLMRTPAATAQDCPNVLIEAFSLIEQTLDECRARNGGIEQIDPANFRDAHTITTRCRWAGFRKD